MIKVNLLRDKTNMESSNTLGAVGKKTYKEILGISGDVFIEPEIHPAVKMLIMILPLAMLYLYEMNAQRVAKSKVSRITEEVLQTQTIRDEKKNLVDSINKIKAEVDFRTPILNEFKKISKEKIFGIRTLDQLQDLTPNKLWVTEVDLDRDKIDITGIASSVKQLTQFQKNFEDSSIFQNILIYNSIEQKSQNGDILISFKMKANFNPEVLSGG